MALFFLEARWQDLPLSAVVEAANEQELRDDALRQFPEGVSIVGIQQLGSTTEEGLIAASNVLGSEVFPCDGCTLCCQYSGEIRLQEWENGDIFNSMVKGGLLVVEDWDHARVVALGDIREEFYEEVSDAEYQAAVQDTRGDGCCVHCLDGKGCAVYHVRPAACKGFNCVSAFLFNHRKTHSIIKEKAAKLLQERGYVKPARTGQ